VLGDCFVLARGPFQSRCEIRTHSLRWELRLFGATRDGFDMTQVCKAEQDVFDLGDQWRARWF
jgi:hypothetical protein